jgi:hypothetical protein
MSTKKTLLGPTLVLGLLGGFEARADAPAPRPSAIARPTAADAADRLRKVGLDPKDPSFSAKLRSLAGPASAAYTRSQPVSFKPSAPLARPQRAGAQRVPAVASSLAHLAPSPNATVVQVYRSDGYASAPVGGSGPPPTFTETDGGLVFVVDTDRTIADPSHGSLSVDFGCTSGVSPAPVVEKSVQSDGSYFGVPNSKPVAGHHFYYVYLWMPWITLGQPRPATVTIGFPNVVTAPYPVTVKSRTTTAKLSVKVDYQPQLTNVGTFESWGTANLANANSKLDSPAVARVGSGNYQVDTKGEDLVGLGVALAPGWKVVSTTVTSAMSAASPQDLSPDNDWRGATVKAKPAGNDLRTIVAYHFNGLDTLDYTLEWTLEGPYGQRPLLTMPKVGTCDQ